MLKEIHEQPRTLEECLLGHVRPGSAEILLPDAGLDDAALASVRRVVLLGCGTAYHAALVGQRLIERLARVPCEVDVGSELRHREALPLDDALAVAVTQSGETADTVGALRAVKERGARTVVACNVLGSLATRVADGVIHARAGVEIGVASTKAFTSQLLALTLLALRMAQARRTQPESRILELVEGLRRLPRLVEETLAREAAVDEVARATFHATNYLFLGRGLLHPIALEGALKLKEISYIHAEGHAAGEMKHGPIALIDESVPVACLCLQGSWYDKMLANVQEAKARDGRIVAVVTEGDDRVASFADHVVTVPAVDELLSPIVAAIPFQLLAYHVGVRRGCDVDQPRNLAKSVTVE
jgi:glucosamine--fructose-6-phosphate aminotransferase (isomerizing)